MKLATFFEQLWPWSSDLTDRQLKWNRIYRAMRREAYHHDKALGRICPSIYFTFERRQYASLLSAARASRMDIATFIQQAALTEAHVVLQLKASNKSKRR